MNAPLREFFAQAFAAKSAATVRPPSKHRPIGDASTGPGPAAKYRAKHPRGGLRQVARELRIAAGLRPLTFDVPGKRERRTAARIAARAAK